MGHALHGGRARADDAYFLVGEIGHECARGIASGVLVVPAASVEGVPLEFLDTLKAGQLRYM